MCNSDVGLVRPGDRCEGPHSRILRESHVAMRLEDILHSLKSSVDAMAPGFG